MLTRCTSPQINQNISRTPSQGKNLLIHTELKLWSLKLSVKVEKQKNSSNKGNLNHDKMTITSTFTEWLPTQQQDVPCNPVICSHRRDTLFLCTTHALIRCTTYLSPVPHSDQLTCTTQASPGTDTPPPPLSPNPTTTTTNLLKLQQQLLSWEYTG